MKSITGKQYMNTVHENRTISCRVNMKYAKYIKQEYSKSIDRRYVKDIEPVTEKIDMQ